MRRGLHEILSVSRSVSYGQAFSGSMSRSELITLVQCDYAFVCESALYHKTTMTDEEASSINHPLSTEPH